MSLTSPTNPDSCGDAAAEVFARAAKLRDVATSCLSDQQLLDFIEVGEALVRHGEAIRLAGARELVARSHPDDNGTSSLAHELGFTTPAQALAKVTGCSEVEARRRVKDVRLLAKFPVLSEAVGQGSVSRGHAEAILDRLAPTVGNADPALLAAAEEALVASSRTLQVDLVDEQAKAWAAALDPDGREPVDEDALKRRFFTIGREQDGLAKVSGLLPVEHAATIRTVLEAYVNPRAKVAFTPVTGEPEVPVDRRTPGQKRADVLRDVFAHHARTAESPDLGGDHPTVWATTTVSELEHGVGDTLFAGAAESVGIGAAQRTADTGGIQEVILTDEGAFLRLGRSRRGFSRQQRRVLVARDGDRCVIPGCRMPARLCEVHHIVPWNHGGLTDVENAVHLCWWHHHEIDTGPWRIRTVNGRPEIRWQLGRRGGEWTPINPGTPPRRRI